MAAAGTSIVSATCVWANQGISFSLDFHCLCCLCIHIFCSFVSSSSSSFLQTSAFWTCFVIV